jgi:hypothetical protein
LREQLYTQQQAAREAAEPEVQRLTRRRRPRAWLGRCVRPRSGTRRVSRRTRRRGRRSLRDSGVPMRRRSCSASSRTRACSRCRPRR